MVIFFQMHQQFEYSKVILCYITCLFTIMLSGFFFALCKYIMHLYYTNMFGEACAFRMPCSFVLPEKAEDHFAHYLEKYHFSSAPAHILSSLKPPFFPLVLSPT
jgi:hypothetical protein